MSNPNDTTGTVTYSATIDFSHFDNRFRSWGKNITMASSASGACTTGICRIWDYRLKTGDTILLNKSGDGTSANGSWSASNPCPSAVDGNVTVTNAQSVPSTYLVNALEVIGDNIGNDNGLCESNEYCIYSPNFGAYQGEGDFMSGGTCTFTNGTITGVQMFAFPTNGG